MKFSMNKHVATIDNEKLFLFAYDIFLVMGIISISLFAYYTMGVFQKVVCVFEIGILIFIEMHQKRWSKGEIFLALVFILLFFMSYRTNPVELAVMFLFIFSARNFSFKRIARHSCNIMLVLMIGIILCAEAGIVKDVIFEGYRHALGFRYVLYAPSLMLNIVLIKVYIEGVNIRWYKLILYFMIDIYFLMKTYAILSCGLIAIVVCYMMCYKFFSKIRSKRKIMAGFFVYSFLFFLAVSFVVVMLYGKNPDGWHILDRIASGRISLSFRALNEYPINLWGNDITWVGNGVNQYGMLYTGKYNYVDNAYINLILESGILFSGIIWGIHTISLKRCLEQNEQLLMFILIVIAAYFLFDNLKLKLVYNTFWLVLPKLLLHRPLDGNKFLFAEEVLQ